jgi:hypothetical protein
MKVMQPYKEPFIEIVTVQDCDIITASDMFGGVDFGGNYGWEE